MTSRCSSSTSSSVRWRIGLRQPPVELVVLLQDVRRGLREIPTGAVQPLLDAARSNCSGETPVSRANSRSRCACVSGSTTVKTSIDFTLLDSAPALFRSPPEGWQE